MTVSKNEVREFLKELQHYKISWEFQNWSITLTGGDKHARWHYQKVLDEYPELRAYFILELAKTDADLYFQIEERAAIREADNLPGDLFSAVMCNLKQNKGGA